MNTYDIKHFHGATSKDVEVTFAEPDHFWISFGSQEQRVALHFDSGTSFSNFLINAREVFDDACRKQAQTADLAEHLRLNAELHREDACRKQAQTADLAEHLRLNAELHREDACRKQAQTADLAEHLRLNAELHRELSSQSHDVDNGGLRE